MDLNDLVLSLFLSFTEFKHSVQNSRIQTMEKSKKKTHNTKKTPNKQKNTSTIPMFHALRIYKSWSHGLAKMEPNNIIPAKSKLFLRAWVYKWAVYLEVYYLKHEKIKQIFLAWKYFLEKASLRAVSFVGHIGVSSCVLVHVGRSSLNLENVVVVMTQLIFGSRRSCRVESARFWVPLVWKAVM